MNTKLTQKSKLKDDVSVIWDILKSLVFFLGIYLFFIGWVYWYYFTSKLGISFSNINIDVVSYYHFGFFALLTWRILLVFIFFTTILLFLYYKRDKIKYNYAIIIPTAFIFFIISFFVTKDQSEERTMSILNQKYQLTKVYFDFTDAFLKSLSKDSTELKLLPAGTNLERNFPTGGNEFLYYNNALLLSLIYENHDTYFVMWNQNKPGSTQQEIKIFSVNKSNVNYATRSKIYMQ